MKRMFNVWLNILLTLIMAVSLFAPLVSAQDLTIELTDDTRQAIEEDLSDKGILKVGMEANYAPYNWSQATDKDGAVAISNSPGEFANGYDVQIAKQLAEALGLELQIVKLEWDGLPPALQSGKIDAIIAGMSPTPERKKQIDFSDSYYKASMVIVVQKDGSYAKAQSIRDFKDAKMTAQLNTFHVDLLDQLEGADIQVPMDTFPTMTSALISNKIDGFLSDIAGAMGIVAANPNLTYLQFDEANSFELGGDIVTDVSVGLRKDSTLNEPINQALASLDQDYQNDLMEQMVNLNEKGEDTSFFGQVAYIWSEYGSQFIRGAINTLWIALLSTIIGTLIGLLVAIYRTIPISRKNNPIGYIFYKILDFLIVAYIEIFRGTPMMVQAMLIFYGLKLFFNLDLSSMVAAVLIVSINTGAYLSEVMRGGITSVDEGQAEAAKAIGMNHFQTMSNVVLPQALRATLPALGNEFVINIKDTSVLNVIAVTELFFTTKSVAGSTYLTFQTFLITSIIYFVLTFATTRILRLIEFKLSGSKHYSVHTSSTTVESLEKGDY